MYIYIYTWVIYCFSAIAIRYMSYIWPWYCHHAQWFCRIFQDFPDSQMKGATEFFAIFHWFSWVFLDRWSKGSAAHSGADFAAQRQGRPAGYHTWSSWYGEKSGSMIHGVNSCIPFPDSHSLRIMNFHEDSCSTTHGK